MDRTKKSLKNLYIAFIGQFIGIIISFVSRSLFIKFLSKEYLGINGLFTNVLQMLSLVELGIGPAIIYSLYKPLSQNNEKEISAIMNVYKKIYIVIGTIIIFLGIVLTPFINVFIKESPNISDNIYIIFLLFVLNSGISYFFSYKRDLIIADQKRYIATIYRYSIYFILNVFQIIVLYVTSNYYLFLILQIVATLIENVLISIKANKLYPFLKDKNINKLDTEIKNKIVKNTKATVFHKVGGLVVNSTDNILISKLVSVSAVGLYSNYYLIINALNTIIAQIFSSVTASVGNLNASESSTKSHDIFLKLLFLNFAIISFCSVVFSSIVNIFIKLWIGEDYIFSFPLVIIITICFYLNGMRKAVLTFKDAFGLYWEDRYKPIAEVIINIVFSILLGIKFGVAGIFLGTIISNVSTCLWIEPKVLYKYGFKMKSNEYFIKYFQYFFFTVLFSSISLFLCSIIDANGIIGLIIKGAVSSSLVIILIFLFFRKKEEFLYFKKIIVMNIHSVKKKIGKINRIN